MADKPSKGELQLWAMSPVGEWFFQEIRNRFPVYAQDYKFTSLEESREMAERAAILLYMGKLIKDDMTSNTGE